MRLNQIEIGVDFGCSRVDLEFFDLVLAPNCRQRRVFTWTNNNAGDWPRFPVYHRLYSIVLYWIDHS